MPAPLPTSAKLLAAGFAASGVVHLVKPEVYEQIVPPWVPAHREVVLGSGVAEILIAAAMAAPSTRRAAGYAAVGLLAGVFPANVQMVLDAQKAGNAPLLAGGIARLPFQWPMLKIAWGVARRG